MQPRTAVLKNSRTVQNSLFYELLACSQAEGAMNRRYHRKKQKKPSAKCLHTSGSSMELPRRGARTQKTPTNITSLGEFFSVAALSCIKPFRTTYIVQIYTSDRCLIASIWAAQSTGYAAVSFRAKLMWSTPAITVSITPREQPKAKAGEMPV